MAFRSPFARSVLHLAPLLALLVISGTSVSVIDPGDCALLFREFEGRYRDYVDAENENWSDLFPSLIETKACFGATHSALTATVADYETSLLFKMGRYEEAEAAFTRFFESEAEHATPSVQAAMLQRRAGLYARTDRPLEALQDYISSAHFVRELPAAEGAEFLIRIGNRFRTLGDFDAALPYYSQADSLVAAHLDDDPDLEAVRGRLLSISAEIIIQRANRHGTDVRDAAAEAAHLLEEALAAFPAGDPDFLHGRVEALLWLAYAYRNRGEPALALPVIDQARRLSLPMVDRYPSLVSWTYTELGRAQLALGNFDIAQQAFQTALSMDREKGRTGIEMESLVDLGLLAEAVADTCATPRYDLAKAYYERAISLAELHRKAFGNLEWSASVFEDLLTPYRNLIRLLLREGRFNEAFLRLDETRARYLQDLRVTNRLRPLLDEQRRARLDSLETAQDDAHYESLNPNISPARRSALQSDLLEARKEANLVMGFMAPPPSLTTRLVQHALEMREQTLLTYFLEGDDSYALVVRPDTLIGIKLAAPADSLTRLIRTLGESWIDAERPEPFVRMDVLVALRAILIQPVEHLLEPGRSLVIVPEGPLTALPFAALPSNPGADSDYASLDYLGRRHPISMELSAALLAEPANAARVRPTDDLLAFGRSNFGEGAGDAQTRTFKALANLPNVPTELNHLKQLFPVGQFALNQDATETALYDEIGNARVIHLASHAVMNPTFPMFSFISLWDDADEDGTLFLYELQNQSLASDLVVLSGCSTARGEHHLGEGMIGLQHAFRAAGAGSTLATMWQVEDRAMTELMTRFYTHLRAGHRKDRALQLAQLDYLDDNSGQRASPFFWAAATLYGSPEPVDWQRRYTSPRTWLLVGVVLLLLGLSLPHALRLRGARTAAA